jgi:hypothetical protein
VPASAGVHLPPAGPATGVLQRSRGRCRSLPVTVDRLGCTHGCTAMLPNGLIRSLGSVVHGRPGWTISLVVGRLPSRVVQCDSGVLLSTVAVRSTPSLVGGVAADTQSAANLRPRVAKLPQPDHGSADRVLELAGAHGAAPVAADARAEGSGDPHSPGITSPAPNPRRAVLGQGWPKATGVADAQRPNGSAPLAGSCGGGC